MPHAEAAASETGFLGSGEGGLGGRSEAWHSADPCPGANAGAGQAKLKQRLFAGGAILYRLPDVQRDRAGLPATRNNTTAPSLHVSGRRARGRTWRRRRPAAGCPPRTKQTRQCTHAGGEGWTRAAVSRPRPQARSARGRGLLARAWGATLGPVTSHAGLSKCVPGVGAALRVMGREQLAAMARARGCAQ
jgi:hypothetical protein